MASNWYVSSVAYTAVTQFAISHAYSIGDIVRQLAAPSVGNERCFRCTTAGTSGGSESAWTLTKAATTTQGTAVFTEVTGNETYQSPGAWAAPHARLSNALTVSMTAGDTLYVAANHAETQSTAISIQGSTASATLSYVMCVDSTGTGHVPPQSGDLRSTATVTTTGNSAITLGFGGGYWYGITFVAGSGASGAASISLSSTGAGIQNTFEACSFQVATTGASNVITLTGGGGICTFINTTVSFGNALDNISIKNMNFVWRDTPAAVSGTATSNLVVGGSAGAATMIFSGVDFSALAIGSLINLTNLGGGALGLVSNCKLNAATAFSSVPTTWGTQIDAINIEGGSSTATSRAQYGGTLTTATDVIRTGGASDGTTASSWKVVSTANNLPNRPFSCLDIAQWNTTTGSSKTVSVEAIVNAAAVLNNNQIWLEAHYLGTAASNLTSVVSSGRADPLATATAVTTSSSAWDSGATTRVNGAVKALGDVMSVSSNAGRIFFCTTAGTCSGSLPGGYASAVDGGSVTDGTAVFRAGCRMTLSVTLTPQTAGLITGTVKVGAVSTTLYVDPLLTVV